MWALNLLLIPILPLLGMYYLRLKVIELDNFKQDEFKEIIMARCWAAFYLAFVFVSMGVFIYRLPLVLNKIAVIC